MHKPFSYPLLAFAVGLTIAAAPLSAAQDRSSAEPMAAAPTEPAVPAAPAVPVPPTAPDAGATTPAVPATPATPAPPPPPPPPPPPEATARDYPVCSATVQDGCINRSEAPRPTARRPHHHRPG